MSDFTLDDVIAEARPRTQSVRLCLRGDLVAEIERLDRALIEQRRADEATNEQDRAPALARRIVALQDEAREAEREFVVAAIGAKAWADLKAAHPPAEGDRRRVDVNMSSFIPAAIAASLTQPAGATAEKIAALADKLSDGQFQSLWQAVMRVNVGEDSVPFSLLASAVLRAFEPSSTIAPNGESPAQSSLAES